MSLIKKISKFTISLIVVSLFIIIGLLVILAYQNHTDDIPQTAVALVQTESVKESPMAKTLTTYGIVNVSPESIQQITVQNEALVQQIFVAQGEHVKENAPLILLSTTTNSLLNLENAKISLDFTKKEFERIKKLRDQFLATNADLEVANQNLIKAEVTLNNIQQRQKSETQDIMRSNCDCNIVSINVQPGQVVAPSTTLLTYANSSLVQVRLGVESEDLSQVHLNQKVIIIPIYNSALSFVGKVSNITDQIDPKTGLIDVIVPLGHVKELTPGSFVRGTIFLEPEKKMLVVPHNAVLYENNKPYVFIAVKGKAELRFVTVGVDNGNTIAIQSGLELNEQIITVGNYELENGMAVSVSPQP